MRATRLLLTAVWLLAGVACGSQPLLEGRYHQGQSWIEFRPDGTVLHGTLGDAARYSVDATDQQTVVVTAKGVETRGRITSATAIEFWSGGNAVADAFAGKWVKQSASPPGGDGNAEAAKIAGSWRIAGETDVLEFKPDGTYQWGPRIAGSYTILGGGQIRMTLVQDGKPSGRLVQDYTVDKDQLKLTAPDGAVTSYQRVK